MDFPVPHTCPALAKRLQRIPSPRFYQPLQPSHSPTLYTLHQLHQSTKVFLSRLQLSHKVRPISPTDSIRDHHLIRQQSHDPSRRKLIKFVCSLLAPLTLYPPRFHHLHLLLIVMLSLPLGCLLRGLPAYCPSMYLSFYHAD